MEGDGGMDGVWKNEGRNGEESFEGEREGVEMVIGGM
jgi:hypothetical protein